MYFGKNSFVGLIMVLTIFVSVIVRPPGTMLVLEGETLTFVICTGGEPETATVSLGDEREEINLECDFFAAQVAALISAPQYSAPSTFEADEVLLSLSTQQISARKTKQPFAPRGPPFVS